MKTILSTLFAAVTIASTVSAARLSIKVKVVGQGTTIINPTIFAKTGQEVSIRCGDVECAFIPNLLKDDSVEINASLREYRGDHADEVGKPHVTAKLGQRVTIDYGDLAFEYTVSLVE